MINLKNKNIIITGASGGIGHEIVKKLSEYEANILATGTKIEKLEELKSNFKNVQILWASVREPYNYIQAKQLGCHIITIPPSIIEKIQKFGKSFDQLTQETVKNFLIDSRKSKFKL